MGMQERTFAVSNVLIPASYAALMCLMPSSSPRTHCCHSGGHRASVRERRSVLFIACCCIIAWKEGRKRGVVYRGLYGDRQERAHIMKDRP